MKAHIRVGATLSALVLSLGLGIAPNAFADPKDQPTAENSARRADPVPVACNGGAVRAMKSWKSKDPVSIADATTHNVPGVLKVVGPTSGKDTVVITLTGEVAFSGGGDLFDYLSANATRNGAAIGSADFAIANAAPWISAAPSWCVRVGPGSHNFRVNLTAFDCTILFLGCTDNTTSGSLDDWRIEAVVYK